MAQDYIPDSDAEFNPWQDTFCTNVSANNTALGVSAGDVSILNANKSNRSSSYTTAITDANTAKASNQTKDNNRAAHEAKIREIVVQIQANPNVTDAQRAALGITVPKGTRTPSAIPTTRPVGKVDNSKRLEHTINFYDESTPNSKKKPDGVRGCEIWFKIGGAPPADPSELSYMATDTKTPYTYAFNGDDGNKTAHYMLRWVNTRGETGPWSETVSVTIGA